MSSPISFRSSARSRSGAVPARVGFFRKRMILASVSRDIVRSSDMGTGLEQT